MKNSVQLLFTLIIISVVCSVFATHCYRCISSGKKGNCWQKRQDTSRNSTCSSDWCLITIQKPVSGGNTDAVLTGRGCATRADIEAAKAGCSSAPMKDGKTEVKCLCKGDYCNNGEITVFSGGNDANKFVKT
ncbi:uncharacterized protein LOC106666776 [Cimex lectularius]|uniref:Protein quiver n=1 Tax=Cimex lectularius TaxID=79782 RepID=A0A8I6RRD0_CIMLE|nr:uncharacterized protein LOC106666776 [Cimex lectularius]